MRKLVVIALACLLAITVASVLPGCGKSDTKQARQYMQAGDDAVNKLNSQISQWQTRTSATISGTSDPVATKAGIEQVKASMADISTAVAGAKAEYRKIKGLKGVDDYIRYADLRIETLDLVQQLLDKANELFDKLIAMASGGDMSGAQAAQQSFSNDVGSITAKITRLDGEAQKLQSDKNL